MPGPDVSALEVAGGVPSASAAIGGREVLEAPASPPPHPTLSVGVALLEAEAEKSVQEEMVALEELPWFGPNPSLEGVLPQEGEAHPSPMAEAPALTMEVGPSTGA
jgi:hypothetical protein